MITKETEWLKFELIVDPNFYHEEHNVWNVHLKKGGFFNSHYGYIKYHLYSNQYAFYPGYGAIIHEECLKEIFDFLRDANGEGKSL